jgi:hypothetical protein
VHLSNSSIAYPIIRDLQSFIFVEGLFFSIDNKSVFYIIYPHDERDPYADASASGAFSFLDYSFSYGNTLPIPSKYCYSV